MHVSVKVRDARAVLTAPGCGQTVSAALVIPTDVADYERVEHAAVRAEEVLGPIDVWINDAFTSVTQIEPDEYIRVTQVS